MVGDSPNKKNIHLVDLFQLEHTLRDDQLRFVRIGIVADDLAGNVVTNRHPMQWENAPSAVEEQVPPR